jgi:hypothetical protein
MILEDRLLITAKKVEVEELLHEIGLLHSKLVSTDSTIDTLRGDIKGWEARISQNEEGLAKLETLAKRIEAQKAEAKATRVKT